MLFFCATLKKAGSFVRVSYLHSFLESTVASLGPRFGCRFLFFCRRTFSGFCSSDLFGRTCLLFLFSFQSFFPYLSARSPPVVLFPLTKPEHILCSPPLTRFLYWHPNAPPPSQTFKLFRVRLLPVSFWSKTGFTPPPKVKFYVSPIYRLLLPGSLCLLFVNHMFPHFPNCRQ